jgi:hypothetical protein
MQGAIVAWALAATIVAVQASTLARSVKETDKGQTRTERQLAALEAEHAALEEWVATELQPWAEEVASAVEEPSAAPGPEPVLPSLPPVPSPTPIPVPTPSPAPSVDPGPSQSPGTPSPSLCLPIICVESPSQEGG